MVKKTIKWIVGIIIIAIIVIGTILIFASKETGAIKIGAIQPLTGDGAAIGENMRQAMELAVEEINVARGINGRNIEIIFEDGECSGKDAVNAANKLINIDNVPVIIGGACSSETLAVAPIAEMTRTVLFSACSTSPAVTDAGDYVFRDIPSDNFEGKVGAKFAYDDLGARKVAILYCLSEWCVGVKQVFKERFAELGGSIVADEGFEQTARDLRTQLTKIKDKNPDLLYFLGYTEASIIGLKQIKELGIKTKIFGPNGWDDPKIIEGAGEAAEGLMYTVPFAPLTKDFRSSMESKTGSKEITMCTPQAYDAVNIIAEIMKRVGTNSEKIKDELYKVKNYQGVSGIITLDKNGDLATANYIIKIVKNGKAVEKMD